METSRVKDPLGLTARYWVCSEPERKHIKDGKVDQILLKITGEFPGCAEMHLGKKKTQFEL